MLANINESFEIMFLSGEDDEIELISEIDEENKELFRVGDEVEILKAVNDSAYEDGKAYVIFNPKNSAAATVYGGILTFK